MPLDSVPFIPPALPYRASVASLCGRRAVAIPAGEETGWVRFVPPLPAPTLPETDVRLRFQAGGSYGALFLPGAVADVLLRRADGAATGPHDPATAAFLLEFVLAEALGRLEAVSGLSITFLALDRQAEALPDDILVGLEGGLQGSPGPAAFTATLALPRELFERMRRVVQVALPPDPPVPVPPALLGVRIGIARLPASVVASLAPGDAIIPDVLLAPSQALLVVGERWVAAARMDGMRLVLDTALSPVRTGWEDWVVSSDDTNGGDGAAAIAPEEAGFGELQVTLVFELGRRTLPMAEVTALGNGHVIELGPVEGATVSVLANGVRLGRGELVRVGDALAIRLTQISGGR